MKQILYRAILLTVLLQLAGTAHGQAPPPSSPGYDVTDLGTLGGPMSQGMGANDDGQVVGASQSGSYAYGFLWDGATMTNLGALGAYGSWAHDINDAGQVVGASVVGEEFHSHAFRWQQNGGMQDLGTLGGPISYAFEINDAGEAVGVAERADDGIRHAVLWGAGGIVDLGDLGILWDTQSAAYGINDLRQVVGFSHTDAGYVRPFLWQNGAMQDLGTLGGDFGNAEAINEAGQVVGSSKLADNTTHRAFLWDGGMQDLGAMTFTHSFANDINDEGQVVGTLQTGQTQHAFRWANGQMQDLNTLIPSGSGWVLHEARAINNKGKIVGHGAINGQTHAFLLSPSYHWINPAGGSWHVAANWQPQGDPGSGDTVVFDLSGQYGVDATPTSGPSGDLGRMVVSRTNTVEFSNLSLNLLDDSVTAPALTVHDEATVKMTSGVGTYIHALVGGSAPTTPPTPPASPPAAHLHVFNSGTVLTGTGRLTIGDAGAGELFVANGAELSSAEARLGGWLPGTAVVGGDGSTWRTGNIAVGYGVEGTLTIENGARVESNAAFVAYGGTQWDPAAYSEVTVDGVGLGSGTASFWGVQGDLKIGNSLFGDVDVLNGGNLHVTQNVHVSNGDLNIEGRVASGPSEMTVLGDVFVGGPGNANLLSIRDAALGGIEGNLIIGKDGVGAAILWGSAITAHATQLDVVDPQTGLCAIGREHDGAVSLDDGGLFRCRNIEVGGRAGTSGVGSLDVDGGFVRAFDVLRVGQDGGGRGVLTLGHDALVTATGNGGVYVAPNGAIVAQTTWGPSGQLVSMTGGTIHVGSLGLVVDGFIETSVINVVQHSHPRRTPRDSARATEAAATLVVDGALTLGPTGGLVIPVAGTGAGQYGSLAVTGAAVLDGTLALDFSHGYAPKRGDTFAVLTVAGGVRGAFARVEIKGLRPGFAYQLATVDGRLTVEALNNGVIEGDTTCSGRPAAPSLVAPKNRTTVRTATVPLDWEDAECADSYDVVVRMKSKRGKQADSATSLHESQYTTKALKKKAYWWRVSACNTVGCTDSAWQRFRTKRASRSVR
ncbi:MAG: hypothetical protein U0807_17785 [Candidatus Binatia bacterium]